jgi:hypothetical protein
MATIRLTPADEAVHLILSGLICFLLFRLVHGAQVRQAGLARTTRVDTLDMKLRAVARGRGARTTAASRMADRRNRIASLTLKSANFTGYWQRHAAKNDYAASALMGSIEALPSNAIFRTCW